MSVLRRSLAGLLVVALHTGVQAREPLRLKPLSSWNLRYDDESCKLVRAFGDAKHPTLLVMERLGPESSLSLMVFGGGLVSTPGAKQVTGVFLPFEGNPFTGGSAGQTDKTKDTAIYWPQVSIWPEALSKQERKDREDLSVRDLAREAADRATEDRVTAAITAIEIRERSRKTILETGSLGKSYSMMRQCTRDQLADWGVDPAVEDKIVRPAKTIVPFPGLFREGDYPDAAIRSGDESVIRARLLIDDKGAVSRCTSLSAYSAPGFADVVCKRLREAKFRPAELADGTRVPTYTTATIRFVLPQ